MTASGRSRVERHKTKVDRKTKSLSNYETKEPPSGTAWQRAGVPGETVSGMIVRGFIVRDVLGRLALMARGCACARQCCQNCDDHPAARRSSKLVDDPSVGGVWGCAGVNDGPIATENRVSHLR